MSLRLGLLLGTHDSFWHDMQSTHDLAQAKKKKPPPIRPIGRAA
jgi:plasmid maintenance system antidote protein VapI